MSNGNRSLKYSGFMKLLCYSFLKEKNGIRRIAGQIIK